MSSVLWVEDQAETDLVNLMAEAIAAGHIITCVGDASSAIRTLQEREYDVVIVDVRIEPGNNPEWYDYYYDSCTGNKIVARLGLQVLRSVWNVNPDVRLTSSERPTWLTRSRVGILTVESFDAPDYVGTDMAELGLPSHQYARKTDPGSPTTRLLDMIVRLSSQSVDAATRM